MTSYEAAALAPSYLHIDSDKFCTCCRDVSADLLVFVDRVPVQHYAYCSTCVDRFWISRAKDCGELEPYTQPTAEAARVC